jgi:hypothetical protein
MKAVFSRLFTLEVNGRPILAFQAGGQRDAQQICKTEMPMRSRPMSVVRGSTLRGAVHGRG